MFRLSKSKHINLAKIYEQAEDLISDIPLVKRRRRRRRIFKFLKYFSYSILALFLIIIIAFAAHFLSIRQIYQEALAGKNNLEQAVYLAKKQNFEQSLIFSRLASDNFNFSITKLQEVRNGLTWILKFPLTSFLESQFSDIEYLLSTAEILSRAVGQGASFGQELEDLLEGEKKLSFSKFSKEEKKNILGRIYQSSPDLIGMKASLDLASLSLNNVRCIGLLWPLRNKIRDLKIQLDQGRDILAKAIPMSRILPPLAGYPEKATYLVLLQNSDELRPTGGFLGTYGILELEYGEILRFDTHDIYHLDMPVKNKLNVDPPEPLKKYLGVDKWFMRDANWSPDWPIAARKIEWFYKKEKELNPNNPEERQGDFQGPDSQVEEFDGLIAITPKFVTDLLSITGPIVIDGEEYNEDNFVDLLQYKVEKGYIQLGVPSWHRKEVIGELSKELKIELLDLPSSRWHEIVETINNNIIEKNISLFVKDIELQSLIKQQGLAGELKDVVGDYLMVVDANMASLKTDEVMGRSIHYEVEQGPNGLFAKLRINYAHHGNFDWKTTRYRTYTRVYVPLGSQLIKAEGDVKIQNELGKTSFAAFISIEPGEIGSLYFEYKLPDNLNELAKAGQYELYIQKQPGNKVAELAVDLSFANEVKSYNPTGFYVEKIGNNRIKWESDLGVDRKFSVRF